MDAFVEQISNSFEKRAKRAKIEAYFYVLVLIGVIAISSWFFFEVVSSAINVHLNATNGGTVTLEKGTIIEVKRELKSEDWVTLVSEAIVRLCAVLLIVYLIQILTIFAKYKFRVADDLFLKACSLRLSNGDIESLDKLSSLLKNPIDFGKVPENPYKNHMDVILKSINQHK